MIKISQKFTEGRYIKNVSLEQASKDTKIRSEFLEAIERGDYNKLPSTAYAYGFIRNYAKYLGFDEKESLALFKREFDAEKAYDVLPKGLTRKDEFSIKKIRVGRNIIVGFLALVLILAFIFFQYRSAIFNPPLDLNYPQELSTVNGQSLKVLGSTDPNSTVYVQDKIVSTDSHGNFSKDITLFPGRTTITVKAINRFGRVTMLERHIEVKPGY